MNRDEMTAHLTLHGWQPVRTTGFTGWHRRGGPALLLSRREPATVFHGVVGSWPQAADPGNWSDAEFWLLTKAVMRSPS